MWFALYLVFMFFFFKQKTAYEMRISDWSSDVCSSDLRSFTDEYGILHHHGSRRERDNSGPTGRARGAAGQHRPAPWRGAVTAPADTGSEALQRALHALQRMQERLESVQQAAPEPIDRKSVV